MDWKNTAGEGLCNAMLELFILHLLSERDMDIDQIRAEIEKRTDCPFPTRARLYGPLYRMEQHGFLTRYSAQKDGQQGKTLFRIEEAGRRYLAEGRKELVRLFEGVQRFFRNANDSTIDVPTLAP